MTSRFPALLLVCAILLSPVAGYMLLVLAAPTLSFWWTPTLRVLFFVLLADLLLFSAAFTLLFWRWLRSDARSPEPSSREANSGGSLASWAWISGILYFASLGTYYCTKGACYTHMDQARYHRGRGEIERARACEERAYQRCLEDGHDPAH